MAAIVTSVRLLLAAATLTACSSAGGPQLQVPPVQPLANGVRQGADGSLVMRIHVSRGKQDAPAGPHYVSPATQAITIAITGPAERNENCRAHAQRRGLFARLMHGDDSRAQAVSVSDELLRSSDRYVRRRNRMPVGMHDSPERRTNSRAIRASRSE